MNNPTITCEENHDRSLSHCLILTHYNSHEIEPLIHGCMSHYYKCVIDHTTNANKVSSDQFSENAPIIYTEYAGNTSEYTCCYTYHNFVVRTVKPSEFEITRESIGRRIPYEYKSSTGVFTVFAMIIPTCPEESEDTLRELDAIHMIPFRQLFIRLRDHESEIITDDGNLSPDIPRTPLRS